MTTFNPKIRHRLAGVNVSTTKLDPWKYLDDISRWDRGPEEGVEWMTKRLQNKWPGNYRVSAVLCEDGWNNYYIVFDTPADETWFRLQYT